MVTFYNILLITLELLTFHVIFTLSRTSLSFERRYNFAPSKSIWAFSTVCFEALFYQN